MLGYSAVAMLSSKVPDGASSYDVRPAFDAAPLVPYILRLQIRTRAVGLRACASGVVAKFSGGLVSLEEHFRSRAFFR